MEDSNKYSVEDIQRFYYWIDNFDFEEFYESDDFIDDYFSDKYKEIDVLTFLKRLRDKEIKSIFVDNDVYKDIPLGVKSRFLESIPKYYEWGTSENYVWITDEGLKFIEELSNN